MGFWIEQAVAFIGQQTYGGLLSMFWYAVLFELPRYALAFFALALSVVAGRWRQLLPNAVTLSGTKVDGAGHTVHHGSPRVSVLVVGHNEAKSVEKCVVSLHEQTIADLEIIIVSDGSVDGMEKTGADLVRRGLASRVLSSDIRCGKSAAFNLGRRFATGEFLVNVDCDSSFDRYAIERLLTPFYQDERVGAASGNVVPRNGGDNLLTAFQVVEYLTAIAVGRRTQQMLDQVTCLSGAFSAFRVSALDAVGGMDVGGGEDFDITLRLRRQGWKVRFVADAECYTAVPTSFLALARQRTRWERDTVRIRMRKHRSVFSPFRDKFMPAEIFHHVDFLLFSVLAALVFPIYMVYLFMYMGEFAIAIIATGNIVYLFVDIFIFMSVIAVTGKWNYIKYLPYAVGFGVFNSYVMRMVRLNAYIQEWALDASRDDPFVPSRVSSVRKW